MGSTGISRTSDGWVIVNVAGNAPISGLQSLNLKSIAKQYCHASSTFIQIKEDNYT